MQIVAFTGSKQAGKDTAANYLCEKYDFKKISFAEKLKRFVADLCCCEVKDFDVSDEAKNALSPMYWADFPEASITKRTDPTNMTFREALQVIGTDVCRKGYPMIWINATARQMRQDPCRWVISDLRFDNEAELVTKFHGKIYRIMRGPVQVATHVSEMGIHPTYVTQTIDNNHAIDRLHAVLDTLMERSNIRIYA